LETCPHCVRAHELLGKIVENSEDKDLYFGSVEVRENHSLGKRFGIRAVPYMIFIENGKMFEFKDSMGDLELKLFIYDNKRTATPKDIPEQETLLSQIKEQVNDKVNWVNRRIEKVAEENFKMTWKVEYTYAVLGSLIFLGLILINAILCCCCCGKKKKTVVEPQKENEKKTN
jgi:thiol-disulfide isomerase/thioredoxin